MTTTISIYLKNEKNKINMNKGNMISAEVYQLFLFAHLMVSRDDKMVVGIHH